MASHVDAAIDRLVSRLQKEQESDGSWRFCFETGTMTDAYAIILLRSLGLAENELISRLAERIARRQGDNGAWRLFPDEKPGNLTATVEAYFALLYAGYRRKTDGNLLAAKRFILSRGGLSNVSFMTRIMLSLTGQLPWMKHFLPLEIMLLPPFSPVHFFDFSSYARVHIAPIMASYQQKFAVKPTNAPDLADLVTERSIAEKHVPAWQILYDLIRRGARHVPLLPEALNTLGLQAAERFMLERVEPDGTLYSYFSTTFFMIFALLALGYPLHHPVISQAIGGIKGLACQADGFPHIQEATSTVWDTALLSYALQTAGVPASAPMIAKANAYLLSRQQRRYGDWAVRNPGVEPGGWGFSDVNTLHPDIDDTTAALRSIRRSAGSDPTYAASWKKGLDWLLSMQNRDGGWAAFAKNTDLEILRHLPIEGADAAATDPSTADLTGRTLEFLGNYAGMKAENRHIQRAVDWLLRHQQADGSWYGRWGISYIYGTWAAVTGLAAAGLPGDHPAIRKAVAWLLRIQNPDGGWGESCRSDISKKYTPLGASTPSQTAWAVDALIAGGAEPTAELERGIQYLLISLDKRDWTASYPTGAGLPGGLYIHYHSYRYIWPLLALSHYREKYAAVFLP
ncbi:squalene--hopene cyclase [Brevibacillus sp. B_LB10_24]|uniref:squalene--hopene cyclase n=1 Tax=Brevibacillus sp. B_LB10_24 TaxID=3380645 RepID=UPI0038B825D0